MKRTAYTPDGVVTNRPINLRLKPAELAEAERVATGAGISKANLARQAFLKGLPEVIEELRAAGDAGQQQAA
ncbi:MAG: hypothetical protein HYU78_02350 [Rhodocyclales bacterium]|nr:hypothetical protein [Rhodocyclales bacterium]